MTESAPYEKVALPQMKPAEILKCIQENNWRELKNMPLENIASEVERILAGNTVSEMTVDLNPEDTENDLFYSWNRFVRAYNQTKLVPSDVWDPEYQDRITERLIARALFLNAIDPAATADFLDTTFEIYLAEVSMIEDKVLKARAESIVKRRIQRIRLALGARLGSEIGEDI